MTRSPFWETDNLTFRWLICKLSREETAALTHRHVRTVDRWDKGDPIPPELKHLMALASGAMPQTLHTSWEGYRFSNEWLVTPNDVWLSECDLRVALIENGKKY